MKNKKVERIIPKLTGKAPMSYDLKDDGTLVVIDHTGKKQTFVLRCWDKLVDGPMPDFNLSKPRPKKPRGK